MTLRHGRARDAAEKRLLSLIMPWLDAICRCHKPRAAMAFAWLLAEGRRRAYYCATCYGGFAIATAPSILLRSFYALLMAF